MGTLPDNGKFLSRIGLVELVSLIKTALGSKQDVLQKTNQIIENCQSETLYPSTKGVFLQFQPRGVVIYDKETKPLGNANGLRGLGQSGVYQLTGLELGYYDWLEVTFQANGNSNYAGTCVYQVSLLDDADGVYTGSGSFTSGSLHDIVNTSQSIVSGNKTAFVHYTTQSVIGQAVNSHNMNYDYVVTRIVGYRECTTDTRAQFEELNNAEQNVFPRTEGGDES